MGPVSSGVQQHTTEHQLRHRRSWAFKVLTVGVLGSALSALSCGDDEPARDQAVLWLQLGTALGATCSSARAFNLPDDGARSIITGNGAGDRLVDGSDDANIVCGVSEGSAAGQYNVNFNLSRGEIGSFNLRGSLTKPADGDGQGMFNVVFATTSFTLQQNGCTGTVRQALPGAVWLSSLSCPGLVDPSSPAITCTGTGGLIAENCSR
jgi:hypothetical protein